MIRHFRTASLFLAFILICGMPLSAKGLERGEACQSGSVLDSIHYDGKLRVYIVEPDSRWNDYSGRPYHFGFLDLAIDSIISVQDSSTMQFNIIWNAGEAGYPGITSSNIMGIAVVFNSEPHVGYSIPPDEYPFTAYYVDATAAAMPGNPGSNTADENQTHTIFIEEATSVTCEDCPIASMAIHSIYQSGNYDFYYAAMVMDENSLANSLMWDYNLYWWPTCFFDGGYKVLADYWGAEQWYINRLDSCRVRKVPDLDLDISVSWLGNDSIEVGVDLSYIFNHAPPPPETPQGPQKVLYDIVNDFSSVGLDADDDQLYFKWEWAEGVSSDWLGLYDCGETATASFSWSEPGNYQVKVMSRDTYDGESEWSSPLTVSVLDYGDANGDGTCDVGDAVTLINYIFRAGDAPVPELSGDANCDALVNVGDAVFIINFVFGGGATPGCPQK
jgi:hypothetical protein